MSVLLIGLSAYTAALAVFGPRMMRGCQRWQPASPRLGLVLWTTLITSWVVSVVSAGLAATAQLSGGLGLAALLHACLRALLTIVGVHDPADAPAAIALVGSLLFLLRLGAVAARHAGQIRRHRNSHRRAVCESAGSYHHDGRGIIVVEAPELAAYCVPGRDSAIVLTTGALRRLSRPELDAVIAHEVAHLRGRHHLCVGWAAVLARAFPFVPLLRAAPREVDRLVEWVADDRAGRQHGNRTVARALAAMATSAREPVRMPQPVLTAAGSDVPERVKRLLRPRPRVKSANWRITVALAVPLLALVAAAAVLVPSATADPTPLCAASTNVAPSSD